MTLKTGGNLRLAKCGTDFLLYTLPTANSKLLALRKRVDPDHLIT